MCCADECCFVFYCLQEINLTILNQHAKAHILGPIGRSSVELVT